MTLGPNGTTRALLAHCVNARDRRLIESVLPGVRVLEDWDAFERLALSGAADSLVIFVRELSGWPHFDRLWKLRVRRPGTVMTLVAEPNQRNAAHLARIEVDHLVGPMHLEILAGVVTQGSSNLLRERLVRSLRDLPGLGRQERDLLLALFLAERPPLSVEAWARAVSLEIRTMRRRLSVSTSRTGLKAKVAVNLNLLLAALESAPMRLTWPALAAAVDVDERRLRGVVHAFGLDNGEKIPSGGMLIEVFLARISGGLSNERG